ncbi:hypothetical protein AAFF_G00263970 [Aldrovandia affinis]|uniref:Uncharacterized protein n=1 Tax=Aldrovandia affinis TaxID=143900 RepID=A0AAD7SSW4_9TELE|nr:hypothetical protein AAFF_G00263970 [Aldrovandia affinis]
MDNVTVDKHIRVYPNQKPWMTKEVQSLLRIRNTTFRFGDGAQYSAAKANLKRGIRKAKTAYKPKSKGQPWLSDTTRAQRREYRRAEQELNLFFARFEVKSPEAATSHPPALSSHILTVEEHECLDVLHLVRVELRSGSGKWGLREQGLLACCWRGNARWAWNHWCCS